MARASGNSASFRHSRYRCIIFTTVHASGQHLKLSTYSCKSPGSMVSPLPSLSSSSVSITSSNVSNLVRRRTTYSRGRNLPKKKRHCWRQREKGWVHFHPNCEKKTHPKTLSSKNTFIQKHFHPKTLSSKTISSKREDNFIHDTFIQKRVRPMTLSSKNGFVQ